MSEQKTFSEEQLREACNDKSPQEAFVIFLSILQRGVIALERIAEVAEEPPTVLFEEAPRSDDTEH